MEVTCVQRRGQPAAVPRLGARVPAQDRQYAGCGSADWGPVTRRCLTRTRAHSGAAVPPQGAGGRQGGPLVPRCERARVCAGAAARALSLVAVQSWRRSAKRSCARRRRERPRSEGAPPLRCAAQPGGLGGLLRGSGLAAAARGAGQGGARCSRRRLTCVWLRWCSGKSWPPPTPRPTNPSASTSSPKWEVRCHPRCALACWLVPQAWARCAQCRFPSRTRSSSTKTRRRTNVGPWSSASSSSCSTGELSPLHVFPLVLVSPSRIALTWLPAPRLMFLAVVALSVFTLYEIWRYTATNGLLGAWREALHGARPLTQIRRPDVQAADASRSGLLPRH
jgi:hypothetical protein